MEGTPSVRDAVARFLEARQLAGGSPATVRTYYALLKPLRADTRPLAALTAADCRQLIRLRLGQSDATAATFYDALHAFLVWCLAVRWLRDDLIIGIHRPKVRERRQPILTPAEFARVRDACAAPDDELILRLLCEGLRASELCGIRWADVRPDRIIVTGKTGSRAVPLTDGVRALLDARPHTGPRVLACTYKALYARVHRWGRQAGVPWLHPHSFRHLAATAWYRETGEMDTMRMGIIPLTHNRYDARALRTPASHTPSDRLAPATLTALLPCLTLRG